MFAQANGTLTLGELSVELEFSSTVRLTRHLLHVVILVFFTSILAFVDRKHRHCRTPSRPFSRLSRLIVSISILGLVLTDLVVINGATCRRWCSAHQIILQLLLTMIQAARLLPEFYEHADQYYQHRDSGTVKSVTLLTFISLLSIQLLLSVRCSLGDRHSPNLPTFCIGNIHSYWQIFLLHMLELVLNTQSLGALATPASMHDNFCQLNSTLLRSYYFAGTCMLRIFFLPGQFSGALYGGVLVIESVLKYLLGVYYTNDGIERSTGRLDNIHTPYLRMKNDDLSDDTRLLRDVN